MIVIDSLSRHYGRHRAVHDVSTTIQRGEVVGLLGHNGAGKTTMMRMLTGALAPTSGRITLDGIDVEADRAAVQRRVGYLPESAPTWPEMLVQDYLATMARLRGVPNRDVRRAVVEAARRTDIVDRLTQPIAWLSKGMRQRVGLAQAIVHRPRVLILDEPTNGLDPGQVRGIRELIRELASTSTVLLSTHILQEVEAVCDRVLVMMQGELVADAPLADLVGRGPLRVVTRGGEADAVGDALRGLDGVAEVTRGAAIGSAGSAPDGDADAMTWTVVADAPPAVDAVVAAVRDVGATVLEAAPTRRTLDDVFRDLEAAHIARAREVAA